MARVRTLLVLAPCLVALSGCPDDPPARPDASCPLAVSIGTGTSSEFHPLGDGDPVEVILGFQGFRMLSLAFRVEGAPVEVADVSTHILVDGSGIEADQMTRQLELEPIDAQSGVIERFLLFFNDAPASAIVGRSADLEVVVRSGGCTGASRVHIELRDDDQCVDFDAGIPDAGTLDGGVPDGSMACGTTP